MDIRDSLDGLKSLLGVTTPPAAAPLPKSNSAVGVSDLDSDQATFSTAGSEVSQSGLEADVRTDKVAAVQAALAAGTYSVPASAVASKVVDSMLGEELSRK
jgi:flagellar biosynthesis anti-sigma factor FlgM